MLTQFTDASFFVMGPVDNKSALVKIMAWQALNMWQAIILSNDGLVFIEVYNVCR